MTPTPELLEAAHKAWKDTVFHGKSAEAATEAALTAALALLPGERRTIDRQKAADAAVRANHAYGQWMPEHWLHLFLDAYEGKL